MSTSSTSAEQIVELVNLMKGSDSVEFKLTVDLSRFQLTEDSVGFDELQAQIRQVVFFDTPDLERHGSGVAVGARRIQGGQGDTVVKLRPVTPSQLPPKVRESKHLGRSSSQNWVSISRGINRRRHLPPWNTSLHISEIRG